MSGRSRKRKNWRNKFHRATPHGSEPGILIADPEAMASVIDVLAYSPDRVVESTIDDVSKIGESLDKLPVTWVSVNGLGDINAIAKLGGTFGVHQLALEDVVNVHQRAKVEQYGDQFFIVCRIASVPGKLETEQVSLFLGKNFVISFQERSGSCLEPVRERIRKDKGRIRRCGVDYLAYALLDAVVDSYFPVLEQYGERLEILEDAIIAHPGKSIVTKIHEVKRDLLILRRSIWPFREAINSLMRDGSTAFTPETQLYLRDCSDHTMRVIDLIETYREISADLLDIYLSSLSNRMNEVMKILAIITTIFVPPTFFVGIYGMNFAEEASPLKTPELKWLWGYPVVFMLVFSVLAGTFAFLWWKGMILSEERSLVHEGGGEENGSISSDGVGADLH